MGSDQDIDTAGTEADDQSARAKAEGFGGQGKNDERGQPAEQGPQGGQEQQGEQEPANDSEPQGDGVDRPLSTTIPDEQAADPSLGAGVRDTGDKGGVS
jgi:hypothetical protein